MIPVAEHIYESRRAAGAEVDFTAIANAAMGEFTSVIAFDSLKDSLRQRLVAYLRAHDA